MIIERINSWIINKLPSRRSAATIQVNDEGLHVSGKDIVEDIRWSEIQTIDAIRTEQLIGDTVVCIISLIDGRVMSVCEDDPVWHAFVMALPQKLLHAKKYEEWTVSLTAGAERIKIYERKPV